MRNAGNALCLITLYIKHNGLTAYGNPYSTKSKQQPEDAADSTSTYDKSTKE